MYCDPLSSISVYYLILQFIWNILHLPGARATAYLDAVTLLKKKKKSLYDNSVGLKFLISKEAQEQILCE